jgi:serine protease inhibitor
VKVEEKGTEAAAATGVVMTMASAPMPKPLVAFKADHPFLFLIRDRETGFILFWGRLSNPHKG